MKIKYYYREFIDLLLLCSFWIILIGLFFPESIGQYAYLPFSISILHVFLLRVAGNYQGSWQYLNLYFLGILFITTMLFVCTFYFWQWPSSEAIGTKEIFSTLSTGFSLYALLFLHRIYWYFRLNPEYIRKKTGECPVLLYGAGSVTMHLLQDLNTGDLIGKYHIAAIVDNDPQKTGSRIGPYKIEKGGQIPQLVEKHAIREIWLTMPITPEVMQKLFETLQKFSITYKVVPRKFDHIAPDIRNARIEDLVQRPEIKLSRDPLYEIFSKKRVLVTGAAGSIGREISRQIASLNVKRLVLIDQNEHGVYELEQEFGHEPHIINYIADIRNQKRITEIIQQEKPQIVFHAAAYKHVPLMERNFKEAVNTNILGTYNLLYCLEKYITGIKNKESLKFINISTDKAVSPENIMGLTKRICELIVYNMYRRLSRKKIPFEAVSVRFGNVLSSSGSVVPLFWSQIEKGGPLTVTDPDMERFFMTIPEAVNLVLHAAIIAHGDDILALDMGQPVKIVELAERLILLSGHQPYKDIDIRFTGIRPGEKLKEELFWTKNSVQTDNPYIFRSQDDLSKIKINEMIKKINAAMLESHSMKWWKNFLKQYSNLK